MRIRAILRFKNLHMLEARKAKNITIMELSRMTGYAVVTLFGFEGFRGYPTIKHGEKRRKLEEALGLPIDVLFPDDYKEAVDKNIGRTEHYKDFEVQELPSWAGPKLLPSVEESYEQKDTVEKALALLSEKEAEVIKLRFGLEGEEKTCRETAELMNLSGSRVQQIQTKAMRKMRWTRLGRKNRG